MPQVLIIFMVTPTFMKPITLWNHCFMRFWRLILWTAVIKCIILINKFCSKRSHHDYEYLGTGELVLDVRWVCPLCYDFDKQMSLLQQSSSFSSWLWVFENRWIGLGCQVGVPTLLLLLPDIVSHADNPMTAFCFSHHRMMEITFASMLTFLTKLLSLS